VLISEAKPTIRAPSGNVGYFKDLAVVKIKSPFLYAGGGPEEGGHTYQTKGDVLLIPIPGIKQSFDPSNKIIQSDSKVNT